MLKVMVEEKMKWVV